MDREYIINYLREVKKLADEKFMLQWTNKRYVMGYQISRLLKLEPLLNDEELLQEAMLFEDVMPLEC